MLPGYDEILLLSKDIGKVAASVQGIAAQLEAHVDYSHTRNHDILQEITKLVDAMTKLAGRIESVEDTIAAAKNKGFGMALGLVIAGGGAGGITSWILKAMH